VKKHINTWTYWLGLVSAVIALVMRGFNAFGVWLPGSVVQGVTVWYMSFYKAALLFLLINIATVLDRWSRALLNQSSQGGPSEQTVADSQHAGRYRTARAGA
jgi:hypothetical protein